MSIIRASIISLTDRLRNLRQKAQTAFYKKFKEVPVVSYVRNLWYLSSYVRKQMFSIEVN